MNTIVLRLDRDTREKLKLLAETTGRPRSTLVREAVRRFVDAELGKRRLSFRAVCGLSLKNFPKKFSLVRSPVAVYIYPMVKTPSFA